MCKFHLSLWRTVLINLKRARSMKSKKSLLLNYQITVGLQLYCLQTDTHFASQNILLPGTLCFLKHFAPPHILRPGTLYSVEHSAPWNTLLLCKMFSPTYFVLWNTKSKVFNEAKWTKKKSILEAVY